MKALAARFLFLAVFIISDNVSSKRFRSRFTDLKCESFDEAFAEFKICKLKVIGRGVIAANVYTKLLQLPIHKISINWSFWRRYNGYQPFLYNISGDLCKLLAKPKHISFEAIVLSAISSSSNLNHSCPIDHDIILKNLVFKEKLLHNLPLPNGMYKLKLRFAVKKAWKLQVEPYLLIDE